MHTGVNMHGVQKRKPLIRQLQEVLTHGMKGTLGNTWEWCLCKNCPKSGRIASKCRTTSMCKQCHKYHHTLGHIKADLKTEDTKNVSKEMNHVASLKWGGEVLLRTCRIKVIAPDGTVIQARAILDSTSSTSLISEGFAKKVRTTASL